MSLTFVQGDTGPAILGQIVTVADQTPINLSGATVRFQMRKQDDKRFTVNSVASITTAAEGRVSYSWAANDLATPGEYQVQWEVTFPDTTIITTEIGTITVRRQ